MLPNCVSKMYAIAVLFISSKIQSPLFFLGTSFLSHNGTANPYNIVLLHITFSAILYMYQTIHIIICNIHCMENLFRFSMHEISYYYYIYNIIVSVFKKKVPPVSPILLYKKTKNTNQNFECLLLYMFCLLQKKLYVC